MKQYEVVYNYMKTHGGITSSQAFYQLGVSRLSGVIFNLKEKLKLQGDNERIVGETITVDSRYGKTQCTKYRLVKVKKA